MSVILRLIYTLNVLLSINPIKILADIFGKKNKLILKFLWKWKGPRIAKAVLKKAKLVDLHYLISRLTVKL